MSPFQTSMKSDMDFVLDPTNYMTKPQTKEPVDINGVDLEPISDSTTTVIPDLSSSATNTLVFNSYTTLNYLCITDAFRAFAERADKSLAGSLTIHRYFLD